MSRRPEERLGDLADALAPSDDEVARLRARARATAPPRRRRWIVAVAAAVAAVVAARQLAPGPRDVDLGEQRGWRTVADGVQLGADGDGVWTSEGLVAWHAGTLDVEVDPAAGTALTVRTADASIRVVGTRFLVDRGPFGTEVTVARGRVEVTCTDGRFEALQAGEHAVCMADAAGALGYVLGGRAPGEIVAIATRGLGLAGSAAVHDELRAARIDAWLTLGEPARAFEDAGALRGRSPAVQAVRQRLVAASSGCAEAVPLLQELLPDPVAAVRLADCTDDPDARRELLEQALQRASPELQPAIRQRLAAEP